MVCSRKGALRRKEEAILSRARAVELYHKKGSLRAVAEDMECSPGFVRDAINRKNSTGLHSDRPRSGRPRVTTRSTRKRIRREARETKYGSVRKVQAQEARRSNRISISTVWRSIRAGGLRSYRPTKRTKLSIEHKQKRLEWCIKIQNESEESVLSRVFSDEKYFCFGGVNNRVWLYPWEERPAREVGKSQIAICAA